MTDPSRVPIPCSLEPFAAGFATELARQGYTPRSLRTQLSLMSDVNRWLHLCPGGPASDGCPVGSLRRRAPVQGTAGIGASPFDSTDGRFAWSWCGSRASTGGHGNTRCA